jgi:mannosyltransferase OCH1-like enzyme
MIPHRIFRVVPEHTSDEVEGWWKLAIDLHPGWEMITYRDPIDPGEFPITGALWADYSKPGAQIAGLVRLELLWHYGAHYIDSDVDLVRSLEPLCSHRAYAAWEDANVVPDAVLGAVRHHPAIETCLELAAQRAASSSTDWRTGNGPWATGPGVTTTVLAGRDDVTLLDPESFYPVHYSQKDRLADYTPGPDTYGIHHWHGSWL